MATQIFHAASLNGDQATIDYTYDDTNNLVNLVTWRNDMDRDVRVVVSGALQIDTVLAPGSGGQIPLAGGQRFKYDTDAWSVSLSS